MSERVTSAVIILITVGLLASIGFFIGYTNGVEYEIFKDKCLSNHGKIIIKEATTRCDGVDECVFFKCVTRDDKK